MIVAPKPVDPRIYKQGISGVILPTCMRWSSVVVLGMGVPHVEIIEGHRRMAVTLTLEGDDGTFFLLNDDRFELGLDRPRFEKRVLAIPFPA